MIDLTGKKAYSGNREVQKMYLGTNQFYSKSVPVSYPPPPEPEDKGITWVLDMDNHKSDIYNGKVPFLTITNVLNYQTSTHFTNTFSRHPLVEGVKFSGADSRLITLQRTFNRIRTPNINLLYFNTEHIVNFWYTFERVNVEILNLSTWSDKNARSMLEMFRSATITILDISNFDLRANSLKDMFMYADIDKVYVKNQGVKDRIINSPGFETSFIDTNNIIIKN